MPEVPDGGTPLSLKPPAAQSSYTCCHLQSYSGCCMLLPAMCPHNYLTHLTELRAVPGGRRVTESEPATCAASTRGGAGRPAAPGTPPPGVGFCNIATDCSGDTSFNTQTHTPDAATQRHTAVATRSLIRKHTHQMLQLSDTLQWRHFCIYIKTHMSDAATQRDIAVATRSLIRTDTSDAATQDTLQWQHFCLYVRTQICEPQNAY